MSDQTENVLTPSVLNTVATASLQKEIDAEIRAEDKDEFAKAEKLIQELSEDGNQ